MKPKNSKTHSPVLSTIVNWR